MLASAQCPNRWDRNPPDKKRGLMATSATSSKPVRGKKPTAAPSVSHATAEVLTLAEAADYLRVSTAETLVLVSEQGLPGRRTSDDWRFLKNALQEWLKQPERLGGPAALLSLAGKFADDPFLEQIVGEAYRQRGRPVAESRE